MFLQVPGWPAARHCGCCTVHACTTHRECERSDLEAMTPAARVQRTAVQAIRGVVPLV